MWGDTDCSAGHRECCRQSHERWGTVPNVITAVRTVLAVGLALYAAGQQSLALLLWATGIYWVGDMMDGAVARMLHRETRIGAVLDIICDRACATAVYVGLVWWDPGLALPVAVYLLSFCVLDLMLSLSFLGWPLSSPNYFALVDRTLYAWNWSTPAKALNSALFLALLLLTGSAVLGTLLAVALAGVKVASLVRLGRVPGAGGAQCAHDLRPLSRV